jgi:hypothetical protein
MRPFPGRWPLIAIALMGAGIVIVAPVQPDRAAAQPEYTLYYSFEVPLSIQGIALSEDSTKRTFNGALRGTLGGISITDAKYTYANGASTHAGGGTFSMITKAAPFKDGHILMTNDGKQTTLLFLGIYLGARVSFSLTSADEQIGGSGVTATGLAETNFRSHEEYVAAIRNATAALAPATREQLVGQAEQNPRLVREYRQRSAPR